MPSVHDPTAPGPPGALSSLGSADQKSRRLEFTRKWGTRHPHGEEEQRRGALGGGGGPTCLRGHGDDRRASPALDRSRGSEGLALDSGCDCWLGHHLPGNLGPPPEAQDGPSTAGDHVTQVVETGSIALGTWAAARQKEQSLILY